MQDVQAAEEEDTMAVEQLMQEAEVSPGDVQLENVDNADDMKKEESVQEQTIDLFENDNKEDLLDMNDLG